MAARKARKRGSDAGVPDAVVAAGARGDPAVTELLASWDHPLTPQIRRVRELILAASPRIRDGVKWNAPSFRTSSDWFATLNNPRAKKSVMLILHTGATAKGIDARKQVADPDGLVRWLANDRGLVTFADAAEIEAKRTALTALVRAWVRLV